jgi:PAS domain S-box-containing protein
MWRTRLEEGKTVISTRASTSLFGGFRRLALVPASLEGETAGFLGLWDWGGDRGGALPGPFLRAVRAILEIWMARLNLEKRLLDFVEFIPNATFVMHRDGAITMWNRATAEMTGWDADRVVGRGNYEHAIPYYGFRRPILSNLILHPDPKWEATYPEFRREGDDLYTLSFCPALPDGGAYLTTKTSRIYDLNHRLWGAIHTVRDVSRERRMEKSLHRSESMYRTIAEFAGVGIMLLRHEGVLYANERVGRFMGISHREVTIEDLLEWVHPEDRDAVSGSLETLFDGQAEALRFEFRARRDDGLGHYRGFAQVIEYEDRPTVHFVLDDVSEQKELAHKARLNELRMYHEDRLTALGIMAAGIAHELNQPLNTVRVVTDGLLYGRDAGWAVDAEELYDNLEMVSRQVTRMAEVIQNIRDFAREDRGHDEEDVNPNVAVENVFAMLGRQLEAHGIRVRRDLASQLPAVRARMSRLEQVIMNLVVNARQALDDCGHGEKDLWVRTALRDGHVTIEVGDNATGIAPGLMNKIFDPFFTTKEVGKGTGLGLTITQSIVAEMGGRLEAFNNEQGGATFVVSAPAGRA